jgi:hypothetical protein
MNENVWFLIGLLLILAICYIYRWAEKNTYHDPADGTTYHYETGKAGLLQYVDSIDEHSPENLDFDRALKAARLRTKLIKIEEEREEYSAPFIPMTVTDYLLLRQMKGYSE